MNEEEITYIIPPLIVFVFKMDDLSFITKLSDFYYYNINGELY